MIALFDLDFPTTKYGYLVRFREPDNILVKWPLIVEIGKNSRFLRFVDAISRAH